MPAIASPHDGSTTVEKPFFFRCFVYRGSDGLFVAECIDLDLMVKARKSNKATRELRDAIVGYVRIAVGSGQEEALIPRPSPLSHRLHYHAIAVASKLSLLSQERLFACTPTAPSSCCA